MNCFYAGCRQAAMVNMRWVIDRTGENQGGNLCAGHGKEVWDKLPQQVRETVICRPPQEGG